MPAPEQSIFRDGALKKYRQRQEQGILLRVVSPPIMLTFWLVLLSLAGAAGLAWSIQIPVSVQGQGLVVEQKAPEQAKSSVVAVLFLAPSNLAQLHVGQSATVSIASVGGSLRGSVASVGTSVISPDEARSSFNLQGGLAQIVTGPSISVTVFIGPATSARVYAGSLCVAQIQVGSESVLSLLPFQYPQTGR